ncbi:MAG TPA: hypothetical protein VIG33_08390 [Pseudobdellovibrionaceae bacterium]|jgi:hypothetical protein
MKRQRNERAENKSENRFSREESRKHFDRRESERHGDEDYQDFSNRDPFFDDEGIRNPKAYRHSENRRR